MDSNTMLKWVNGASGQRVREIIEHNFDVLNTRLNERVFAKSFISSDWQNGVIKIDFYEHRISAPSPHVLMLYNGNYVDVQGGAYIDTKDNVYLQADIPYDGKVVIK